MLRLFSLLALAGAVAAQGRWPCSVVNGDGTIGPDQSICDGTLVRTGEYYGIANSAAQGDRNPPYRSICTVEPSNGMYFCGWKGATCLYDNNCDNGRCVNGQCTGTLGDSCDGRDSNCLGWTYCLSPDYGTTYTCGGNGAFCKDPWAAKDPSLWDGACQSGFCSPDTNACAPRPATTTTAPPQVTPPPAFTPWRLPTTSITTTSAWSGSPWNNDCGGSNAYFRCKNGAANSYRCCKDGKEICDATYQQNLQNCLIAAGKYYPCPDYPRSPGAAVCCDNVFNAYFGEAGMPGEGEEGRC
ncbi:hypothetical protein JCM6882_002071 [Rhodosporidiobolus microsporus]